MEHNEKSVRRSSGRKPNATLSASCKRADCRYFARSTKTCDYRIATGIGRGEPVQSCGKYEKGARAKSHISVQ